MARSQPHAPAGTGYLLIPCVAGCSAALLPQSACCPNQLSCLATCEQLLRLVLICPAAGDDDEAAALPLRESSAVNTQLNRSNTGGLEQVCTAEVPQHNTEQHPGGRMHCMGGLLVQQCCVLSAASSFTANPIAVQQPSLIRLGLLIKGMMHNSASLCVPWGCGCMQQALRPLCPMFMLCRC